MSISKKKTIAKKSPAKKTVAKKAVTVADGVSIRMYCLGTGDCFLVRFHKDDATIFTMMIDCGSCSGNKKDFQPYIDNLVDALPDKTIDLLVVTHEHNDHVNGFAKCIESFEQLTIKEAWFAWTENPVDPGGAAAELKKKQQKMKRSLSNAIQAIGKSDRSHAAKAAFLNGLDTLADINLPDIDPEDPENPQQEGPGPLPGMKKIKDLLLKKKVHTRYLNPGETVVLPDLPDMRFYVLGPPSDRSYIYTDGREGTDVYNKNLALNDSALAINALLAMQDQHGKKDCPFSGSYLMKARKIPLATTVNPLTKADSTAPEDVQSIIKSYNNEKNSWRRIDEDWLSGAGALALRLNSHINNTSLVLAIESTHTEKVLLFPGDAEYGSWESWHLIKDWMEKGKDKTPWAQDLLRRTVFYKVGHHLSFNGTALEKGIRLMTSPDLAAMASLDRQRIAKAWTTTMPNKLLLQELIRRTQGKCFIMDEFGIESAPSKTLNPGSLGKATYETGSSPDGKKTLYKEYTISGF